MVLNKMLTMMIYIIKNIFFLIFVFLLQKVYHNLPWHSNCCDKTDLLDFLKRLLYIYMIVTIVINSSLVGIM